MLVDSHAHLTSERLRDDVEAVVQRASEAGIDWIVSIGSDVADSRAALEIAKRFDRVFATAGLHPHQAESATAETWDDLETLADEPRVVAIGETGLDYFYDHAPRAIQQAAFERQLDLAQRKKLGVIIHAREADDDVAATIRNAAWERGVLHCFSSGKDLMETALDLGWYISFAGMVTFKNWDQGELLKAVPLDRLLVETDSPYLSPVPMRGKRNEPAHVVHTARRMAEIRGESAEALFQATARNAASFYGVDV